MASDLADDPLPLPLGDDPGEWSHLPQVSCRFVVGNEYREQVLTWPVEQFQPPNPPARIDGTFVGDPPSDPRTGQLDDPWISANPLRHEFVERDAAKLCRAV